MTKPIRFRFLFEPRDLWIGVYWDAQYMWNHYDSNGDRLPKSEKLFMIKLKIFITLIPMFPLLIAIDIQPAKKWILQKVKS